MIIKIKSHKRPAFQKILEYLINDKDRLYDHKGKSFLITHNLKGDKIDSWVSQFKINETYRMIRRKGNILLTHEILSWHRDDSKNLNLVKLENMAREYLSLRNTKGIYVAVPHFDKNHYHIHICASGLEYRTGKSLRLSKAGLLKLKKEMQQYQLEQYPELSKSVVNHGSRKNKLSEKEFQFKLRTGRETDKEYLKTAIDKCIKKSLSKEMVFEQLKGFDISFYERSGKLTGVIYKNQKFRLKRLGVDEIILKDLTNVFERNKQIKEIKLKRKENLKNLNR